ncbi:unknown [Prevotella sp. CAG:873]|nr:unknown [Prevotella sp. CAG:873]
MPDMSSCSRRRDTSREKGVSITIGVSGKLRLRPRAPSKKVLISTPGMATTKS